MPLKVLLIDDHDTVVRLGLRALLERAGFEVIGPTSDGNRAVQLAATHYPHLAVLDEALTFKAVDTIGGIRKVSPRTWIVLLTMYTQGRTVLSALSAGACSVIVKSRGFERLLSTIAGTYIAEPYPNSPSFNNGAKTTCVTGDMHEPQLHGRSRQVLQLVAEGKTTKETASILGISVRTAEFHRHEIREKLDITRYRWFGSLRDPRWTDSAVAQSGNVVLLSTERSVHDQVSRNGLGHFHVAL